MPSFFEVTCQKQLQDMFIPLMYNSILNVYIIIYEIVKRQH